ncbi:MAG: MBL fold metallo-hydrolase [Ignavibacterium sp.]|nr:MAG: MBL fold metallo-hydrolase [Ignavibacterium sp.]
MAEIIFIGTGSGKTSLSRFHSSFLISTSRYNLLVDAGDGVSKALLSQGIDCTKIDGILFTHLHPDHYTGIAALIVQMKMYNRKDQLDIFVNSELVDVIKNFLINSYLFPERMEFSISYNQLNDNNQFKINDEINVLPRQNTHLTPISELPEYKRHSFSCSSFLLGVEDKHIHYTGDIGNKDDLLLFREFNPDFLITEITHINLSDILDSLDEDNLAEKIFFTHISDEDGERIEEFLTCLPDNLVKKFVIAQDGLKIPI